MSNRDNECWTTFSKDFKGQNAAKGAAYESAQSRDWELQDKMDVMESGDGVRVLTARRLAGLTTKKGVWFGACESEGRVTGDSQVKRAREYEEGKRARRSGRCVTQITRKGRVRAKGLLGARRGRSDRWRFRLQIRKARWCEGEDAQVWTARSKERLALITFDARAQQTVARRERKEERRRCGRDNVGDTIRVKRAAQRRRVVIDRLGCKGKEVATELGKRGGGVEDCSGQKDQPRAH